MRRLVLTFALWVLALPSIALGQAYPCPRADSCHGIGQMAMSPDGSFVAFTLMQSPATQFVLFETESRRTYIIRAPQEHTDIGDLAWSADSDELTFVSGDGSVLGGAGSSVWRLRPRDPSPLVLLARIPHVRCPVLTADGSTLAAFEGVVIGDPPYHAPLNMAFALFERALLDGRAVRRSEGHIGLPPRLSYDRGEVLYLGGMLEPKFARSLTLKDGRVHRYWGDGDENNRWTWEWRREIRDVFSFRLAPGEMLPAWPQPFPASGALRGARALRPTNDGRVIVFASLNNASSADWYDERGMPRIPTRQLLYGYIAYNAEGVEEQLPAPAPDRGDATGGADISADGLVFARVISRNLRLGIRPAGESWDSQDTLQLFERGDLVFEARTSELASDAAAIRPVAPYEPLMPVTSSEPHRVEDR